MTSLQNREKLHDYMTALQIMIPRAIHSSHPDNYRNNAEFVININNNVR